MNATAIIGKRFSEVVNEEFGDLYPVVGPGNIVTRIVNFDTIREEHLRFAYWRAHRLYPLSNQDAENYGADAVLE